VPGVTAWRVDVTLADGTPVWAVGSEQATLAYPADKPDLASGTRYLWGVSGDGPLGRAEARRAFHVLSAEERRTYERARESIRARVAAPLRDLVLAQFALRRGLDAEAETAARAFSTARPQDAVGRETLGLVLRRIGVPEERVPR
jgi:hypothetical protein